MPRHNIAQALICTLGLSACNGMDLGLDDSDRLVCATPSGAGTQIVASRVYDRVPREQLEEQARLRDAKGLAAARVLGERYENGIGVRRDPKKAATWYRIAALIQPEIHFVYSPGVGKVPGTVIPVGAAGPVTPGDPIAMRLLGEMYRRGSGIPADNGRADVLIACAGKLGVRDVLHPDGSPI